MNGLIRASLKNPYAVTVMCLSVLLIGTITLARIPIDILPVFRAPAVQVLTFYGGMPAEGIEKDITGRIERWTNQANGIARQESRSLIGASIVRNYFQSDADPNGALTQVNSLALAAMPTMPPGTLPPIVLPYDPTSSTPISIVAVSGSSHSEATLYDTGRYEVRPMIMNNPGAITPIVYGGKVRAVMLYLDRIRMESRGLAPVDVMKATDQFNIFLPTGSVKVGDTDYAIDSNSMIEIVERMGAMPLKAEAGNVSYIRDVATPKDSSFVQTNIVRVDGNRQVYIPIFRQTGASTLTVVDTLKKSLKSMQDRLSRPGIDLKLVMDQSVYVRSSIAALVQEGLLGAILCSLVILLFLGQWRMTLIAILTLPLSVLGAIVCLYITGNTVNVMTLAGLALAIGPMVDSAIICLENTHRHLGLGVAPEEAAYLGASEVALPELVSTLCTFLVLAPLALMPGMGVFLFRPMALAVAFAMISAYLLSRTLVPSFSALLLQPHVGHSDHQKPAGWLRRIFRRWETLIDRAIALYLRGLDFVLRHRISTIAAGAALFCIVLVSYGWILKKEFFPEVDSGAFEMVMRGPSGLRIEKTEEYVAQAEGLVRETIGESDLQMIISEIGVVPDWSAAFTPNAGPMDTILRVQLSPHRQFSAEHHIAKIRAKVVKEEQFSQFEFGFDSGGMIRSALNEGKSNPIRIRVIGKQQKLAHEIASAIKQEISRIDGVVDARILQRLNYPQFVITVDRQKSAELGLTQEDVMRNVVAAANSSISFNKKNFWIDPVSYNQYFVGVTYPEQEFQSMEDLLDIPLTGAGQQTPILLRSLATIARASVPTEATHVNLQSSIDLVMSVAGRDLGHVAADVHRVLEKYGRADGNNSWIPFDPNSTDRNVLKGFKIVLSGEYSRMQDTFTNLFNGLLLAILLMYFLMVALDKSWIVPLTVMLTVPLALIGILPFLYHTGTALNVQSLLGIIFIVGIKVANTVLLTDYAQELRRHEGLSPSQAIRKAASVRVRPVTMTALAAFFAMIPAAMALEHGSEANAPLARAILGGLIAGEPATLFVLPCLYSLLVRDGRMPQVGVNHESSDGVPDEVNKDSTASST